MECFALKMADIDEVATLISACCAGDTVVVTTKKGERVDELVSSEDIPRFHKIALADLEQGAEVHKYGCVIGGATAPIVRGDYVHIHNIETLKAGV